jgi:ceramide glucosyltransferase
VLETLLFLVLTITWLFWLVAWKVVHDFLRHRSRAPAHFSPPISILKPIKGLDPEAYENWASFCEQEYPCFELLFGLSDPEDPAISVVKRLQKAYPERSIRLVVGQMLGSNRKASLLHHLAKQAQYEMLVISDSDMRVTPDYLRRVVAPLADDQIGLVTCPYRGGGARKWTAQIEALYMGVTFLPLVVIASRLFSVQFAMGSTAVLRRKHLTVAGGFTAIADHLADDYQLGARIAQLGLKVYLSDYVVTSVLGSPTFRELWHREVRWARCNRVSRPLVYPGLLLTFSTPLALVLLLVTGFAPIGWLSLGLSLSLRWLIGWQLSRHTGDRAARGSLIWLPLRDILSTIVWCAGGVGRHVVWRGERFVLQGDGRMHPLPASTGSWLADLRAWRP